MRLTARGRRLVEAAQTATGAVLLVGVVCMPTVESWLDTLAAR